MKYLAAAAIGLVLATSVIAQDGIWKDAHGHPVPETAARRSLNGLGGSLLVTPDANWREKWDTPANVTPQFNQAGTIVRDQQVFILIFFANPKLDAQGRADLTCDIDVVKPDGTSSGPQQGLVCFRGEIKGGPYNTYLAAPVIGFTGDATDPSGEWTVSVALKDNLRNTVLPLKTTFVLK